MNIIQPHDKILCNSYRSLFGFANAFTHRAHDLIEIEAYNRANTWEYLRTPESTIVTIRNMGNEWGGGGLRECEECRRTC